MYVSSYVLYPFIFLYNLHLIIRAPMANVKNLTPISLYKITTKSIKNNNHT